MVYLIFILSVALAAGGVVLSTQPRNKYQSNVFSTLLYYQVFIYTFGFYGIWGQAIIKQFLAQYVSPEDLLRISGIALLMGLPFLVFAWLMLIQLSLAISGKNSKSLLTTLFLLVNFSALAAIGYYLSGENKIEPDKLIKGYYIVMNFLYTTVASAIMIFSRRREGFLKFHDRKSLASFILMIMILQGIPLLFYESEIWIAVIFILIFFAGNTYLPVYLNYGIVLPDHDEKPGPPLSFDEFCAKFDVSPRETDIIREICNGLSNKEIAEKLFISLQTVKDHTHRIYIKTNVRSRAQLITLVREMRLQ